MSADDNDIEKTSIVPSDTFKEKMEKVEDAPPSLVMLMGPINLIGKQWQIEKEELRIGRSLDAEICVDDRSVSRGHALVKFEGDHVFVEDIGSSNGTEVDGNKLVKGEKVRLTDNIQLKTGNVIFKFLAKGNLEVVSAQTSFDRSQIDALTQIYNKRAFLDKVDETFKRAKVMDVPLTLVVFDLDKFKNVNDNFGHRAGDFVLQKLSEKIRNQLRPGDFFARYGGEEFTLLLGGTELGLALDVADRLRNMIEDHEFKFEGQVLPVTISIGVATITPEIGSWEDLFELADKALYSSKENGRNRVTSLQSP
ncbi:MAG: diguanylate cyclase [Bdellovibrionales bacterium]